jgi:hypothetical protein
LASTKKKVRWGFGGKNRVFGCFIGNISDAKHFQRGIDVLLGDTHAGETTLNHRRRARRAGLAAKCFFIFFRSRKPRKMPLYYEMIEKTI